MGEWPSLSPNMLLDEMPFVHVQRLMDEKVRRERLRERRRSQEIALTAMANAAAQSGSPEALDFIEGLQRAGTRKTTKIRTAPGEISLFEFEPQEPIQLQGTLNGSQH